MNKEWNLNNPTATNGTVYVDLDNDGDLDVVGNNINDPVVIYQNNTAEIYPEQHYLKIQFKGDKGNTLGIGTKVILNTAKKQLIKELYVSRGFQSAMPHQLHFGLGKEDLIEKLTVIWANGKTEILKDIKANQLLTVDQIKRYTNKRY